MKPCARCNEAERIPGYSYCRPCKNRIKTENYRFNMRGYVPLKTCRPRIEDPLEGNPSPGALRSRLRRMKERYGNS